VVDDSITTRTLERSILEARGYRVLLSVDGLDALDQLRRQRVDLVVVDIEMPRMDGFELLRAMKQDEALSDTPVILVTSRDSPQDRHKGLTLGAQAYIIKQHFDQRDLLNAIEQIL
jgi:two-component system chemotaxis sensor kinase CheA